MEWDVREVVQEKETGAPDSSNQNTRGPVEAKVQTRNESRGSGVSKTSVYRTKRNAASSSLPTAQVPTNVDMAEIESENIARISRMTVNEITEARREIEGELPVHLVTFLRNRKKASSVTAGQTQ